jgi:hypothetical protein
MVNKRASSQVKLAVLAITIYLLLAAIAITLIILVTLGRDISFTGVLSLVAILGVYASLSVITHVRFIERLQQISTPQNT